MVEASYKGTGFKMNDWLLVGILAAAGVGVYLWYKNNPFIKTGSAIKEGIEGGIKFVGNAVDSAASAAADTARKVDFALWKATHDTQPVNSALSPSKDYIPDDNALKALGYSKIVQTDVSSWTDLTGAPSTIDTTKSLKKNINEGYGGKLAENVKTQLSTAKQGPLISESVGLPGGLVITSTGKSYQINVGSGTGSSSGSKSKSLSPQKGVTNIKSNISAAQSSKQPLNLIGLGKGARINLDTGAVSY